MTTPFTLPELREAVGEIILISRHATDAKSYRQGRLKKGAAAGLFGLFEDQGSNTEPEYTEGRVIWATDNYSNGREHHEFSDKIDCEQLSIIIPRVEKTKAAQAKRVKEKAEVFTPSWVCNLQNNLIDDEVLYEGAFNTAADINSKTWMPNPDPIKFTEAYTWANYITEQRLEITCGEGPYLVSPYDTTTGERIPVRDETGRWMRIGLLDRKLRVVSENVSDKDTWRKAAMFAMNATFGYEWQGDNLLLARLNFVNTYGDYYREIWNESAPIDDIKAVAEIASWNLWQMDGLKMIEPESCSAACPSCVKKARCGHDGRISVIRMGAKVKTFEELLPESMF